MKSIKEIIEKAKETKSDEAQLCEGVIYFIKAGKDVFECECSLTLNDRQYFNEEGIEVTPEEYRAARKAFTSDSIRKGRNFMSCVDNFGQIEISFDKF